MSSPLPNSPPPPHPVTPLYSITSSHSADDHAHSITYTHRTPTYPIYLDNNATTCIAPEVAQVMLPYMFTYWGNPSSSHVYGAQAKTAMITARQHVATCIGAQPSEIIFTSGATESIMYAFTGLTQTLLRQRQQHVDSAYTHRNHIITVTTEHVAVLEVCRHLHAQYGIDITYLSVDQHGSINIDELTKAITDKTFLVSLMLANNESGTLHPVSEISRLVKRVDPAIIVHTDASQAMGKIEVNVETLGVDLLTIAGHKLYAPKGIGCLYVVSSLPLPLTNLMHGGGQESGHRAGTENVILAAALGEACRLVTQNGHAGFKHMHDMRRRLEEQIRQQLCAQTASSTSPLTHDILNTRLRVHGHPTSCLPNTLSLAIHGVNATRLLSDISSHVAASAGAACHSDATHLSHVLEAMHIDPVWGRGTVRLTTGRYTTPKQVDEAAERIAKAILSQWLSPSTKS